MNRLAAPRTQRAAAAKLYKPDSLLSGAPMRGMTTADQDARSPAAQTAAQTGVPVSFDHIVPEITADSFTLPGGGPPVNRTRFNAFLSVVRDFEREIGGHPQDFHRATRAMAQRLLDMHVEEIKAVHEELLRPHAEAFARQRARWVAEVDAADDFGKRRDTVLTRLKGLMADYGRAAGGNHLEELRTAFAESGIGDRLPFLRFVRWIEQRINAKGAGVPEQPRGGGAVQARRA